MNSADKLRALLLCHAALNMQVNVRPVIGTLTNNWQIRRHLP